MRSIVFLGLTALVCGVCCRDLRGENSPRQLRPPPPKDKRGLGDHPLNYPSHGGSYSPSSHSSLTSGYGLGGGSFAHGHSAALHSLGGSIGHGIGYSLAPSSGFGFGSGYLPSGLNHGSLGLQGVSLNGLSAQSTYSVPSVTNFGLGNDAGNNKLFISSKTGPVTFGLHGGNAAAISSGSNAYSTPVYSGSGGHGLSAYSNGATSNFNFPVILGSSHSSSNGLPLSSSGASASYNLPTQAISSNSLHPVTSGLVIGSNAYSGPSSYNIPLSGSSHALGNSPSSQGTSSAYILPLAANAASSSGSYGSSNSQISPANTSGSYSSSASSGSNSYANYLPAHSDSGSTYSSGTSSSHSSPSVNYAAAGSSYSGVSSGYSPLSSSYKNPSSSYSSPAVTYSGTSGSYTSAYSSPTGLHGTPSETHGAYSNVNPRYLGYATAKSYDNTDSDKAKYDTISYSTLNGKY